MNRPKLKRWYVLSESTTGLALRYGDHAAILRGAATRRFLPRLLSLLDGTRTVTQLKEEVDGEFAPGVEQALSALEKHGVIYESADERPGQAEVPGAAFLAAAASDDRSPNAVARALEGHAVAVAGTGAAAKQTVALLREGGVGKVGTIELASLGQASLASFTFAVVVPAGSELPYMESFNRIALQTRLPWMQVLPFDGVLTAIGPLFMPHESCCYRCYAMRREANDDLPAECTGFYDRPAVRPESPAMAAAAAGLGATLALRWLATEEATLPGELYALEYRPAVAVTRHCVFRVPRCPECSSLSHMALSDAWSEPRIND